MKIQPVRILIASLLSSVVIFFWGFVFWTLIPAPGFSHQAVPKEDAKSITDALSKLERGTYVHPGMQPYDGETNEDWVRRHETESVFMLSLYPRGADVMPPKTYLQALLHGFVASVIAGMILSMVGNSFCCYSHRVFFVACLGLFATIWVDSGESVWWMRTCGVTVWHSIYHIVSWILAGLVIAAFVGFPAASGKPSV